MTKIFGHRGASGYAPENTLEAFELAAKQGADGVELDVHISRDGELVVAHDETIDRVSDGTGLIAEQTLKELRQYRFNRTHPEFRDATIPTLREVFELLKPYGIMINIELKNSRIWYDRLEEKVVQLADETGMREKVIYSSFNHRSMMHLKEIDASLPCGLLYEATMFEPWVYAESLHADAIHPHFSEILVKDEVEKAHASGLQVNVWTVNEEQDIRMCLDAGVDILIGNFPDRALRIRDGK
ncbi:MAG: glycerophosphodiester phosphodiesterase [Clostridia bacterium]|nr:glycerophosphodiester phosphodiesterase [Clostridia bacterium]